MSMFKNPDQPLEVIQTEPDNDGVIHVKRVQRLTTGSESHVQQQFTEEADINNILRKYQSTGLLPSSANPPMYADFMEWPDYEDALNTVIQGDEAFMSLSSDVRARFENDPAQFLAFAIDPENKDQMSEWGFLDKRRPSRRQSDP